MFLSFIFNNSRPLGWLVGLALHLPHDLKMLRLDRDFCLYLPILIIDPTSINHSIAHLFWNLPRNKQIPPLWVDFCVFFNDATHPLANLGPKSSFLLPIEIPHGSVNMQTFVQEIPSKTGWHFLDMDRLDHPVVWAAKLLTKQADAMPSPEPFEFETCDLKISFI